MNYKTITLCAVLSASTHSVHGMHGNNINTNGPLYPNRSAASVQPSAPFVTPLASMRNGSQAVQPPLNPISQPAGSERDRLNQNADNTARLVAALEALNRNLERLAIAQEGTNNSMQKLLQGQKKLRKTMVDIHNRSRICDQRVYLSDEDEDQ